MTIINHNPKYAEKYTSFILIKFIDLYEHLECFFSGKLFIRSQTKFDNVGLGQGRADNLESATIVVSGENDALYPDVRFVTNEKGAAQVEIHVHNERPDDYKPPYFTLTPNEGMKRKLFCTYTLWCGDNEFCEIKKEMVTDFGKYGAVITDRN